MRDRSVTGGHFWLAHLYAKLTQKSVENELSVQNWHDICIFIWVGDLYLANPGCVTGA